MPVLNTGFVSVKSYAKALGMTLKLNTFKHSLAISLPFLRKENHVSLIIVILHNIR